MNTNNSKAFYVIGLMSGTSLDGLDLCYVRFKKTTKWNFKLLERNTVSYPAYWQEELQLAHKQSKAYVAKLNKDYSDYLNQMIHLFISDYKIEQLDLIASHGHTIWHQPEQKFTKQIGDHPAIANKLKVPVVVDFRSQDVALGGQGAPLVPVGDEYLFEEYEACLNLGGFANISMKKNHQRIAYDICPFNKVINHYAAQLGKDYDNQGKIAAANQANTALLNALNALNFYQQDGPKSLGVEFLDQHIFPLMEKYSLPSELKIASFSAHVIQQICKNLIPHSRVLITGGGAYNKFIINEIKKHSTAQLTLPSRDLIEFKEAIVFSFLGVLKYLGKTNVLKSVTGASKNHISGKIILAD